MFSLNTLCEKVDMIPKTDWLQVYVSLKLLKFYAYSTQNGNIKKVRLEYQDFLEKEFPLDEEKNNFDSIPNLISFAYLTLVRSHELLKKYIDQHQEDLYSNIANKLNLRTENDFIARYTMIIMLWENFYMDEERRQVHNLRNLVNKIRNSISHFRYTITGPNILLQDGRVSRQNNEFNQNFRISLPTHQLLNLIVEFTSLMSDYLKENNLIDWSK